MGGISERKNILGSPGEIFGSARGGRGQFGSRLASNVRRAEVWGMQRPNFNFNFVHVVKNYGGRIERGRGPNSLHGQPEKQLIPPFVSFHYFLFKLWLNVSQHRMMREHKMSNV